MITQENITLHELIGLDAEVVKCNNAQTVGLYGKIIDETKSMLILNTEKGIKKIPKANTQWKFSFDKTETLIDGNLLAKRPQERVGTKT
ncbi:MAG TPA: ribonuclease P protein subunit [Nitrosopumilaceae archaeon]|nr:ribonuclease P protein subunit [Nitrosopumilaceae archaeon]